MAAHHDGQGIEVEFGRVSGADDGPFVVLRHRRAGRRCASCGDVFYGRADAAEDARDELHPDGKVEELLPHEIADVVDVAHVVCLQLRLRAVLPHGGAERPPCRRSCC